MVFLNWYASNPTNHEHDPFFRHTLTDAVTCVQERCHSHDVVHHRQPLVRVALVAPSCCVTPNFYPDVDPSLHRCFRLTPAEVNYEASVSDSVYLAAQAQAATLPWYCNNASTDYVLNENRQDTLPRCLPIPALSLHGPGGALSSFIVRSSALW